MSDRFERRTVLRTAGLALAGAIAGCSGGGNDNDESPDETSDGTDDTSGGTPDSTATPTPGGESEQPTVAEFLSNTSNFDGIDDMTGQSSVEIAVGAEGNGAYYAFSPPAIRVDAGTTVTWRWTGQGGVHNVVARSGAFDSGSPVAEEGHTFEYTFDETGTYLYYCDPHKNLGMKGAVVVE